MTPEIAILGALAIPAAGAIGVAFCSRAPNIRELVTLCTGVLLLLTVITLVTPVLAGARPSIRLFEIVPALPITFEAEPLGMLFGLVASSLWIVNSMYSIGYMRGNDEAHQTRFYVCFALALACTMGIAFAGNLITLFLFYEALTLVTYPLVTHHGGAEARRGGRLYLGILLSTSIALFLPAVIATWSVAGTLQFTPGGMLAGKISGTSAALLLALYMFGIGKAALMPVHRWLPAAMVAPTPVSALLHAVAVVKAGVFAVVKIIVYVFGTTAFGQETFGWLPWVAGFTILAASVVAMRADNLKRRLAYSTVSQLSYIVLSAALLTPLSVAGAALHIVTHAFGKITLFFAAGAIYTAAHKTEVSQLDGIGRRMPWTMGAFTIGALSIIGIPPAAGFFSKWFMFVGTAESGQYAALGVLILSTLLNAAYLLPIVHAAFFRAEPNAAHHGEAPWPCVVALVITATATLALPFFADVPLELSRQLSGAPR